MIRILRVYYISFTHKYDFQPVEGGQYLVEEPMQANLLKFYELKKLKYHQFCYLSQVLIVYQVYSECIYACAIVYGCIKLWSTILV